MNGNCINFRFCNQIVNLIIQNQQQRNDSIEAFIKKSICGYEGADPKVCCPGLIFGDPGTAATSAPTNGPSPFIFSSINSASGGSSTVQPQTPSGQPTFSPLTPTNNNPQPNPPVTTNQPSPIIFGSISSPTTPQPLPITTTTTAPPRTSAPLTNRLPTYDADKCGITYAVKSRIVG